MLACDCLKLLCIKLQPTIGAGAVLLLLQDVMEERLLKRGQTSGRADDNAETIRKRFKTFVVQSKPVIDHYVALGKCHVVSAVDSPDKVFETVQAAVEGKVGAGARLVRPGVAGVTRVGCRGFF